VLQTSRLAAHLLDLAAHGRPIEPEAGEGRGIEAE
jgi:hypothetical protein